MQPHIYKGLQKFLQPFIITEAAGEKRPRASGTCHRISHVKRQFFVSQDISDDSMSSGLFTLSWRSMGLLLLLLGAEAPSRLSRGSRRCALTSGSTRSSLLMSVRWRPAPCAYSARAWCIVCTGNRTNSQTVQIIASPSDPDKPQCDTSADSGSFSHSCHASWIVAALPCLHRRWSCITSPGLTQSGVGGTRSLET